jgi:hypothetical protein
MEFYLIPSETEGKSVYHEIRAPNYFFITKCKTEKQQVRRKIIKKGKFTREKNEKVNNYYYY